MKRWRKVRVIVLLMSLSGFAGGAGVEVRLTASVLPASCTLAQRAISRSCAPVDERLTIEPARTAVQASRERGRQGDPHFEVRVEASRRIIIRTLSY